MTVRTLHHYDEVALIVPSGRTEAGYRLYAPDDLERLQLVLFYRELGFALHDIKQLLDRPEFDRGEALRTQRDLLISQAQRLNHMIKAVDQTIAAHERGDTMTDEEMFEVFGAQQRELQADAEQRWGDTDAYRESRRRTRHYSRQDWEELKAESEAITLRIADVYRSGVPAHSVAAMDAVEAHRLQITERFYDCSHEMQVQIGEGYVQDPRFAATYEAIEPGLTVFVRDAIHPSERRTGNVLKHDRAPSGFEEPSHRAIAVIAGAAGDGCVRTWLPSKVAVLSQQISPGEGSLWNKWPGPGSWG